ncbi:hypothetical protein PHJA_000820500 [Phtheirospermum japonicum]|uniref:Uncharacterized protein n=1 Tax=Phtheirospermum japonicum TaxID=374723 RepID=A0A830BHD2_9LAMI|nr:hypothetical protein PHJA_000820500 [Phtheirospermum japonicum]
MGPNAANSYARSAAASPAVGELRKKRRNKLIIYTHLFAIFQTGIILIFSFIIMKV